MSTARLAWLRLLLLPLLLVAVLVQAAEPEFPPLTGRVVDAARLLSPESVSRLDNALAEHERKTSEQVVVATVPTLGGYEIEDYGYQLGRHWGIGRAGKDNGLLLIVAPKERRVRIEVGYGLEGVMTDARSRNIIEAIILPRFRQGEMEQGIVTGTTAVLSVLQGRSVTLDEGGKPTAPPRRSSEGVPFWLILLIMMFIAMKLGVGPIFAPPFPGGRRRHGRGFGGWPGGFGGGRGGGGFGGGGGSFGGGGASGRW